MTIRKIFLLKPVALYLQKLQDAMENHFYIPTQSTYNVVFHYMLLCMRFGAITAKTAAKIIIITKAALGKK